MKVKAISLISFLIVGCVGTGAPIRLEPDYQEYTWIHGEQVITQEGQHFTIGVSYSGVNSDGYRFNVFVTNKGQDKYDLLPNEIRCYPIVPALAEEVVHKAASQRQPVIEVEKGNPLNVVNPEFLIDNYEASLRAEREEPTALAVIGLAAELTDIFYIRSNPKEEKARIDRNREREEREKEKEKRIADLEAKITTLKSSYLRRHTLSSRETVNGYVLCPRESLGSMGVALYVPVKKEAYSFVWNRF